jgi:putative ABC transport system permease protein
MKSFLADLRFGVRSLARHPSLALISVLALGLGIGLTATMWSIVWGGILRGLPFEKADQILHLERARPSHDIESYAVPVSDFVAWREQQHSFEDLSAWGEGTVNVSGPEGRPERFEGAFITAAAFPMLRVHPMLGRLFTEADNRPGAPPVIILGWNIWQNRYGGDRGIVGKTVRANGVTREVIGVMPRGFLFPTNAELWIPRVVDPVALPWGEGEQLEVMGRLRPGVTLAGALTEFRGICSRLAEAHPKENEGVVPIIKPFTEEYIGTEPIIMLWTMMAAVLGVLMIACSNVANLLLARAATRTKEVAVRTALGASRWRVASQLLAEALILAASGSLLGIGIAWVGVRWFVNGMADTEPPFWVRIELDGVVLLFTLGVTVLSALISGVVPALQASRTNLNDVLKDEGRGSTSFRLGRFSKALVVLELALSGALLIGAGFMIQSVVQLSHFDYGVPTDGVFTARIGLFESNYPDSASRATFWTALEQHLQEIPGQSGVALTTSLPGLWGWTQNFGVEGTRYSEDRDYPRSRFAAVSPGWFRTFRLEALDGRVFNATDIGGSLPVAVVTRGFAEQYLGSGSVLGRRLRLGRSDSKSPWLTIVGVIPDVWLDGTESSRALRTAIIAPIAQGDYSFLSIAARASGDPGAMATPVQAAVSAVDPDQPIYFVRTLVQAIQRSAWFYGIFDALFVVFGGAALFLATVGVYGVVSFSVSRRTQEIGVRMALGASQRNVLALFLRQGVVQIGAGILVGLVLAWFLAKGLALVMFQVNIRDPLMYLGVAAALAVTSFLAVLVPARRALGVDPMVALRYE